MSSVMKNNREEELKKELAIIQEEKLKKCRDEVNAVLDKCDCSVDMVMNYEQLAQAIAKMIQASPKQVNIKAK